MLKIISLILVLLFAPFTSKAEEIFDSYFSSYFDKDFNIELSETDNELSFYINSYSLDSTSKQVVLMVKEDKLPELKSYLNFIAEKYSAWKNTAIENNVTELDKEIEYNNPPTFSSAFTYGGWKIDFSTKLTARFKVSNNKHLLLITSGKLQSSTNQYIDSDGMIFVFSSIDEINDFNNKLDLDKAKKKLKSEKNVENLFQ